MRLPLLPQTVQLCVRRNYGGLITSSIFKLVQTPIAAIGQAQLPLCVIYTALLRTLLPTGVCCKVYAVKQFANSNVQVALCSNIIDAQMMGRRSAIRKKHTAHHRQARFALLG